MQLQLNLKFARKDSVKEWHDDDGDLCVITIDDPHQVRIYGGESGTYIGIDRRKSTEEYLRKEGYDGIEG